MYKYVLIAIGLLATMANLAVTFAYQTPKAPTNPSKHSSGPIVRTPGKPSNSDFHAPALPSVKSEDKSLWGSYIDSLAQSIAQNWHPPVRSRGIMVIVGLQISASGELLMAKIVRSSGVPDIDKAALEAVQNTAPFHALPRAVKKESVKIEISLIRR